MVVETNIYWEVYKRWWRRGFNARGRGALPIMTYRGRLRQKGVPFEASDIGKGRNFTTVEPLQNGHLSPCKGIQDSLGFWIPNRILGIGFQIFFSGTWIPDSYSCIPDSKAQDSGFHMQKFPGCRNHNSLT